MNANVRPRFFVITLQLLLWVQPWYGDLFNLVFFDFTETQDVRAILVVSG